MGIIARSAERFGRRGNGVARLKLAEQGRSTDEGVRSAPAEFVYLMPRPKARLRGYARSPKPSLIIEHDVVLFERLDGEMSGAPDADATHVQLARHGVRHPRISTAIRPD
jgi:hypothetical protein